MPEHPLKRAQCLSHYPLLSEEDPPTWKTQSLTLHLHPSVAGGVDHPLKCPGHWAESEAPQVAQKDAPEVGEDALQALLEPRLELHPRGAQKDAQAVGQDTLQAPLRVDGQGCL